MCIPSSAGESLQLSGTLFPPAAHHGCLSGPLSVYDDKVKHYLFPCCITTRFALIAFFLVIVLLDFVFLIRNVSINQLKPDVIYF